MSVQVLFLSYLSSAAEKKEEEVVLPSSFTAGGVLDLALSDTSETGRRIFRDNEGRLKVCILRNGCPAKEADLVCDGDVLKIVPVVSGG